VGGATAPSRSESPRRTSSRTASSTRPRKERPVKISDPNQVRHWLADGVRSAEVLPPIHFASGHVASGHVASGHVASGHVASGHVASGHVASTDVHVFTGGKAARKGAGLPLEARKRVTGLVLPAPRMHVRLGALDGLPMDEAALAWRRGDSGSCPKVRSRKRRRRSSPDRVGGGVRRSPRHRRIGADHAPESHPVSLAILPTVGGQVVEKSCVSDCLRHWYGGGGPESAGVFDDRIGHPVTRRRLHPGVENWFSSIDVKAIQRHCRDP
jgi:hypothetical protein